MLVDSIWHKILLVLFKKVNTNQRRMKNVLQNITKKNLDKKLDSYPWL